MASTADSKAAFTARLADLKLSDLLPKFKEQGWDKFGDFGFALDGNPSSTSPEDFSNKVIAPLVGDASHRAPKIRRLYAQAYAIASADLDRYMHQKPEEPVHMHPAEKEDRYTALSGRITGFKLQGAYDPGHKLIDRWTTILAKRVRYIGWERCTTRAQ